MESIDRRGVLRSTGMFAGAALVGGAPAWIPTTAHADPAAGAAAAAEGRPSADRGSALDTVVLGDTASETAHAVAAAASDTVAGELGQSARVLNSAGAKDYWGGTVAFTLKVDPKRPTYVSAKFWGGDFDPSGGGDVWRLQLFLDGRAMGWFDQAVVDNIDMIDVAPRLPGAFYVHTLPLPLSATRGKTSLTIEIRAMGRIWPYGNNTDNDFYFPMTTASRGIYRAYTHTDPYFRPAHDDEFGSVAAPTTLADTDAAMIERITARVLDDQGSLLYGTAPSSMDPWQYETLLRGYYWPESPAYRNADALGLVCQAIDAQYLAWKADGTGAVLTASAQQWEGFGRVGLALFTGWNELQSQLDEDVSSGPTGLFNLGFEGGTSAPYGWNSPGWASDGSYSRDTAVSRSGTASLKIASSGGSMLVASAGFGRTGYGQATYSCWVRTDGKSASPHTLIQFYDAKGTFVSGSSDLHATTGSTGWQQLTDTVDVPAGATQYQFWMAVSDGQTAWFDDVTITTPDPSVTERPLANPGFESGSATPTGWSVPGWANSGSYGRDTTVSHGGTASLKIVSTGNLLVIPTARGGTAAGSLSFSCWAKTDGTATTPHVLVQFWDADNTYLSGSADVHVATGSTDWQQLAGSVTVPDGATQYEFWLNVQGTETAWFDDVEITVPQPAGAAPVPRRAAYRDMLLSSRGYWRQNTRHYTNQNQFTALGIYECNRGLSLLSPADAWPQRKAMDWVYVAVGLLPFSGSEDADGNPSWVLGHDYHVVTPKGLSRELGYVGDYGETTGMLARMYQSVREGVGGAEDTVLKARMVQLAKARGIFRYQAQDAEGNRAMRIETMIGWRNEPFPGDVVYGERTSWDDSPISATATFLDPDLIGYAQQMVADGQFSTQLALLVSNSLYSRVGLNAFKFLARDLAVFQAQPASAARLPGRWDGPDFTFTDEVNGCLAVKRGQEVLYSSLYFRARQGVNDLARVHLLTPQSERSGTVRETSVLRRKPDRTFTVQDWVCWDFAINNSGQPSGVPAGGWAYPGPTLHQAFAGEVLHLAPVPADVNPWVGAQSIGEEAVLVGKAPFYTLDYAGYIIAMNTTTDQTFGFTPDCSDLTVDHRTGRPAVPGRPVPVPPLTTVVLFDPAARAGTPRG
ncbi:hypothetical protein EDD99_5622 [Streptomyces sp. 846.5]|nr:Tat pathway signal sequence domain protein [Streptomyces sp. 846.5]TDT97482.1 hypothetical protein EDD99_5622 [Streptomyces sp. 846.5]